MAEAPKCSRCGAALPSQAPGGHCLACLLQLGLAANESAPPPRVSSLGEPGDRIGRYKLLQEIGEGGAGVVYMAEQEEPVRRRVALKIIKLGMDTRQVVARFEAERQALALMDHPYIAKVFDAGATDSGRPYFVMELICGVKITDYCDQQKLSTRQRLDLFIHVCQAVQHAHQKGIIHRDLKPSNILVTEQDGAPTPKIIDFGIAKATTGESLTNKTVFTAFEQFIGTPAYMSPEQAGLGKLDIDTRSDIYSLGVLLYELLTGQALFDRDILAKAALEEVCRTIREVEAPRPSARLTGLTDGDQTTVAQCRQTDSAKLSILLRGDLDWIVMKALEKDRTRRYETANGLAMDLQHHLDDEPVIARPASAAYRFQKLFRRNKLAFVAIAAVAAALLLGLAASAFEAVRLKRAERVATKAAAVAEEQRQRATRGEMTARREAYAADMYLAQQELKDNSLGQARHLLDRHRPKHGEEDLRGWEWRYLWQLTRSAALVTLTNGLVGGFSVSFSPDGSRLAVAWSNGRVDLWDVPNRQWIRTLVGNKDASEGFVAFSPVRNLLVAASEGDAVSLYDIDSSRESILWRSGDNKLAVHDLEFSPDGSRVVIYVGSNDEDRDDEIHVVNVSTAKIESRHATGHSMSHHFGAAQLSSDNQRLFLSRGKFWNYNYSIQCLDLTTSKEIWQTEPLRDSGLTALAISPDGRVLASGSGYEDPSIHVWDAATGRLLARLAGHTRWVCKLAFSKDGRHLISAAADQSIRIWDTATWTEAQVLRGHRDEVKAVAISGTGHLIASASKDGDLNLWDDEGNKASNGHLVPPEHLLLMPLDRSRAMLVFSGKEAELFDFERNISLGPVPGLGPSKNMDVLSFGANWLCHWDTNQIVIDVWNGSQFVRRGVVKLDSANRPTGVRGVCFDPAKQLVAWNEPAASNSVFLAALLTSERPVELKSDIPVLYSYLFFSDDGKYLAAELPETYALRVWNVDTGKIVVSSSDSVTDAAFSSAKHMLAASFLVTQDYHEIRFYDLDHPDRTPRCIRGKHEPSMLAISPDGKLVAASIQSGLVRLCDAATGELIEDMRGNGFAVAFSKDGRRLISAGGGRDAVKLLDIGTRQELLNLSGTGPLLWQASWSADGDTIFTGARNQVWQAWHAPSWQEIAAAEAKDPPSPGYGGQVKADLSRRSQAKAEAQQP